MQRDSGLIFIIDTAVLTKVEAPSTAIATAICFCVIISSSCH